MRKELLQYHNWECLKVCETPDNCLAACGFEPLTAEDYSELSTLSDPSPQSKVFMLLDPSVLRNMTFSKKDRSYVCLPGK